MNIKAIIFDLDGVLIHTDEFHYMAWKKVFDGEGIPFDRKINERLRGVSRMESLEIGLEKAKRAYSLKEKEALAVKKNNVYRASLERLDNSTIQTDVTESLKALKNNGFKLAVASSSKNAGLILDKTGLRFFFNALVDGNDINKSKPDPEVFLKAALKLNEQPSHCMVVEDAFAGIEAAKKGGMTATAIGFATACNKADFKIKTLSDILPIIKGM